MKPICDPNLEVPAHIIEAARAVEMYFKERGSDSWELCGICSRDRLVRLENAISPFVDEFKGKVLRLGRNSPTRQKWNTEMPDHFPIEIQVTMGNCREAVRAYYDSHN